MIKKLVVEKKASRRGFLSVAATAVVVAVVAGVGGYYVGLLSAPGPSAPITVTKTVTETATITTTEAPPAKREIVYGIITHLTGALSAFGEEIQWLNTRYADQINREGGVYVEEYGTKLPLRIIWYDDGSDPTKGVSALERAVLVDKADFVYPSGGNVAVAIIPSGIKRSVFMAGGAFGSSAAQRKIVEEAGYKYIFSTFIQIDRDAETVLKWAKEDGRPKTILYWHEDSDEGVTYADGGEANAKKYGIEVLGREKHAYNTKDYTDLILKAKALDPDIIDTISPPPDTVSQIKQMRELGYSPRLFGGHKGPGVYQITQPNYPYFEGCLSPAPWNEDLGPKGFGVETAKAFEKEKGYLPSTVSVHQNEAIWILKQAIEYAGTFEDKDKLAEILHTREFKTPSFPYQITVDPKDGTTEYVSMVTQYQKMNRRTIYPYEYATVRAWYPMPSWEEKFPAVGEYKPPPSEPL